jgi:hypothetical protein
MWGKLWHIQVNDLPGVEGYPQWGGWEIRSLFGITIVQIITPIPLVTFEPSEGVSSCADQAPGLIHQPFLAHDGFGSRDGLDGTLVVAEE